MADELFGDRRKGLEEEYFRKREQELIEKLRQRRAEDASRQQLAERAGVADEEILNGLQALGYSADTVLLLRYFEAAGEIRQALSVIKKRTGRHERSIRELRFTANGLTIGDPLRNFEGVLTGTPHLINPGAMSSSAS